MNTHKNVNKHGEKILLGGVAAAALGLINAKPQTVKAANQNGTRASKSAASRVVKTKLNYQTETPETSSKTEGEAAANDDTDHLSDNQNTVSDTGAGKLDNNIDSNTNSSKVISKGNYPNNTQEPETGKHVIATKSTDIQYGKWYGADATFSQNTLTIKGNQSATIPQTSSNESANVASGFTDDLHNTLVTKTDQIYKVVIEGPVKVTGTLRSMFFNLPRLTTIEGLGNLDTYNVTDMSSMFADCPKLTTIEGLDQLDASNVTNMSQMFENCPGLKTIDLSKMKIGKGKLTNLSQMFMGCSNLKQLVLPDSIDTSAVTDMQNMFYACSSLTELNLKNVTTDSLQNMNHMFAKCSNLEKLDLSSFYTKSVINMKEIFSNSEDNVTKFSDCVNLKELNIENFDMSQAIQSNGIKDALNKLPALRKLVLGKNCKFYSNDIKTDVGLDTPGTWVNVGTGIEKDPEMSKKWSSTDLMNNYNGDTDHDTYIRFYDGYPVKIHYVYRDKDGKQHPILDKDGKSYVDVVAGKKGETRTIYPKDDIYGYTIDTTIDHNDKVTVTFTDHEQDVYFVYDRATGKSIKVNYLYVDDKGNTKPFLDKGNKPMTETVDGVLYGDQKDIIPKSISGYIIKQIKINGVPQLETDKATVGYSDKGQIVDFIYAKNANPNNPGTNNPGTNNPSTNNPGTGNPDTDKVKAADVTVHYKDEFGNTIAPDEILSGYVGDGYTTVAKNISGYTLKTRPDNATGFFSTFPQNVTYIYTKTSTNNTPNINEPNIPTNLPQQPKKKKPIKQITNNNLPQKHGSSSVAESQKNATLPQTGTNKRSSLAMLALGSLTLVGALGAAWFSRKKIK